MMTQRMLFWLVLLVSLLGCRLNPGLASSTDALLEMRVKWVAIDPLGNTPIVILEEAEGHRAFPIWIGTAEAQAIARALEGAPTPRPMTHDLMKHILEGLNATVTKIVVNDLRDDTFYATIYLSSQGQETRLDARPSDAIALALGVQAPIFATQKVLGAVRTVTLPTPQPAQQTAKILGMHLQGLDAALAKAFQLPNADGVLVAFVETDSAAEHSGLRRGDVITRVDGKPIGSLQELLDLVQARAAQQAMVLHVTRDQQERTIRMSPTSSQ